jgi:hypothetical protein
MVHGPPAGRCDRHRGADRQPHLTGGRLASRIFWRTAGTLEHAQDMAAHASPRTTRLFDRRKKKITQAQVKRIRL